MIKLILHSFNLVTDSIIKLRFLIIRKRNPIMI